MAGLWHDLPDFVSSKPPPSKMSPLPSSSLFYPSSLSFYYFPDDTWLPNSLCLEAYKLLILFFANMSPNLSWDFARLVGSVLLNAGCGFFSSNVYALLIFENSRLVEFCSAVLARTNSSSSCYMNSISNLSSSLTYISNLSFSYLSLFASAKCLAVRAA